MARRVRNVRLCPPPAFSCGQTQPDVRLSGRRLVEVAELGHVLVGAVAVNLDFGELGFDSGEFRGGQLDVGGAEVLLDPLPTACARRIWSALAWDCPQPPILPSAMSSPMQAATSSTGMSGLTRCW